MLMQCVVLLDSFETVSENVMRCLMQSYNLLSRNTNDIRRINNQAQLNNSTGSVGRPSLNISREQVEYLMESNFTVKEMSDILGVSKRTVERRMNQYELTNMNRFTAINDERLDAIVSEIKRSTGHRIVVPNYFLDIFEQEIFMFKDGVSGNPLLGLISWVLKLGVVEQFIEGFITFHVLLLYGTSTDIINLYAGAWLCTDVLTGTPAYLCI